jgi:hypothetical protein
MSRDGTRPLIHRFLVALLAVWMGFTASQSAVHNHSLPGTDTGNLALNLPEVAGSQTGAVCFACLASHVPGPVATAPVVLQAPVVSSSPVPCGDVRTTGSDDCPSGPSRAPPSNTLPTA